MSIYQEEYRSTLTATAFRTASVVTSENMHTDARLQSFGSQIAPYPFHASAIVPLLPAAVGRSAATPGVGPTPPAPLAGSRRLNPRSRVPGGTRRVALAAAGRDRQLETALAEATKLIGRRGGAMPRFDKRPNLARQRLPARRRP
jgi:hypothetical protein